MKLHLPSVNNSRKLLSLELGLRMRAMLSFLYVQQGL